MLARSSKLHHPSGLCIETPLLIPSFSSKGFRFNNKDESEVPIIFKVTEEVLTESLLISAYDGHYNYVPCDSFPTEIVFVDSGGYETSDGHDLSEVMRYVGPIKEWNEEMYCEFLEKWPEHVPAVIVSFDHGQIERSFEEQIKSANNLFNYYNSHLNDFLIKPEKMNTSLPIDKITGNIELLNGFDIIGFTEKELGNTVFKRMQNIARIRIALDKAGIKSPLHIFGSLDPISSCLYFLAGAEIFDGLTWLKYSYYNGAAVYKQNFGVLNDGINMSVERLDATIWSRNIYYLEKLQLQMKNFLLEYDFRMFSEHPELFRQLYDTLCGKLGRRF